MDIWFCFDEKVRMFFLRLYDGMFDFGVIERLWVVDLFVVCWKLINLRKLKSDNLVKYVEY